MKTLNGWIKRLMSRRVDVRLRKSGAMELREMILALQYTDDSGVMRALAEIRARLEDEIMDRAFDGDDAHRLRSLARLEGVNEYFKTIRDMRDSIKKLTKP